MACLSAISPLLYDFCLRLPSAYTVHQTGKTTTGNTSGTSRPITEPRSGVEVGPFTNVQELPELVSLSLGRCRPIVSFCHV